MEAKFETAYELIIAKNNSKKYAVELYSKLEYQCTSIDYDIQYEKNTEWVFESEEEQIKFLQNAIKSSIETYNRLRDYGKVEE